MRNPAWLRLMVVLFLVTPVVSQMQKLGPKDRIESSKLSTKEIQEIVGEVERSAYDVPESWSKELLLRRVDLGASPGVVVQGSNFLCGATGNCQVWVFRKAADKWVSMFAGDQAPLAESFQLGPAITKGIKDFTIVANSSAEASERISYKFDGKSYQPKRN